MIIENLWKKFYVPDEIGNDTNLSVSDVFAAAIPYGLYLKQTELDWVIKEIEKIEAEPDEIIIPNENKDKIPNLEEEKEKLENEILELTN